MKKVTKLSDLTQIDGQVHPELDNSTNEIKASTSSITRLEQLINRDVGFNKFGTLDADVFKNNLDKMNLAELRAYASKIAGVVPASSREKIIKQLLGAFRKHSASFKIPDHQDSNVKLSEKKASLGLDILKAVK